MSSQVPMNSGRATRTFASAELSDVDGVKTSAAASASPVTFLPAVMNGAGINTSGVLLKTARTITVTRSSSTDDYTLDPIVVSGWYGGQEVTDTITPASNDGGDTLYGDQPFDKLTSIAVPAQVNTDGAFSFGTGDICARRGDRFTAVKCDTAITLHLQYDDAGDLTDALPVLAGDREPVAPTRILTGSGETSGAIVTVYIS